MTEPVLTGVGAELKQRRQAAGLAIADVAQQLKLLPRQIESLEQERFDRLPGPTIARGMVRNYAQLLKLDPESLVGRMAPGVERASERERIGARHRELVPSSSPGRRSTLLYAGFSVVLLALVAAMAYEWQREKAAPRFVAAVEPQASPAVAVAPPASEEKPPEQPPASEMPRPAPAKAETPAEPKPQAAAEPAAAPDIHRLVLRMEEEAWLEVRDAAGRNLVSSLSPAGSERVLRGQPPFQLVIGNASHVQLTYDGEPVDLKPHMRGEVARFTLK